MSRLTLLVTVLAGAGVVLAGAGVGVVLAGADVGVEVVDGEEKLKEGSARELMGREMAGRSGTSAT